MQAPRSLVLAVGKPPRPGALVAEVASLLRAGGVRVEVVLPHQDRQALAALADGDRPGLLVHRGLDPQALADVAALQAQGVPVCDDAAATTVLADRAALTARLDDAGVPVPGSRRTARWSDVRAAVALAPRVLKRADDAAGRASGVALVVDPAAEPPFGGPWLVQDAVGGDGIDRKLYVMGDRVAGLLKPGPLLGGADPVRAFEPDAALTALARRVGEVLGVHLYGVDVVVGPTGPVVVDVNAFPGYRGVAGAAGHVVEHLHVHLGLRSSGDPHGSVGPPVSKPRKRRLRPVALAAVRRDDGAVLVQRGHDTSRRLTFHRLIGGGIDFGETAEQAVVREWEEELSARLLDVRLLAWVENLFTLEGSPGHELLAVHVGRVEDAHVLDRDDLGTIPGTSATVHWVPAAELLDGDVPLFPTEAVDLLRSWLSER